MYSEEKARMISPLELAYIGDTVFDLYVRLMMLEKGFGVHDMHKNAVSYVNAASQSCLATKIEPMLDEKELAIFKRGKNAHAHHRTPKSASVAEYTDATGFESLVGYLYLTGQIKRLMQILSMIKED